MPTLVIFGFGYIGGAVARAAQARGWTVRGLVRSPDKATALRAQGIDAVVGDIADDTWHTQLPVTADYVLNAVSASGGDYERVYVGGNRSVRAWAARGMIGTVVYTSTTGVYPQNDGAWVDETASVGGDPKAEILARAEQVWLETTPVSSPRRAFILRLGGIYGPGRHHLLDALRRGETVFAGRGDFFINSIHRDDAVSAIFAALTAPVEIQNQIYNVTDCTPATKETLVRWLAEQVGVTTPVFDATRTTPRMLRRGAPSPSRRVSSEKIQRELGWKTRFPSFQAGYRDLL